MNNVPEFIVDDKIITTNAYGTRIGTVKEIDLLVQRARIQWGDRKLYAWLPLNALKKILTLLALALVASCTKHIDQPKRLNPVYTYRITCDKWELITKTVGQYTITHYECTQHHIDSFLIFQ